jgi:NADH-quinone oxidoreductase subunit C
MPLPTELFPGLEESPSADGMPTVFVARDQLVAAAQALRAGGFSVLIDALPIDFHPREPRFEITYLLLNPGAGGSAPARLRLKVRVPGEDPKVDTLSGVWPAVNWAEREAWDLFGIQFEGHPDLRRVLLPDDWEGHPMRKDYPVQIKEPVKTYEPLQLSPEQFAANIEAAREPGSR